MQMRSVLPLCRQGWSSHCADKVSPPVMQTRSASPSCRHGRPAHCAGVVGPHTKQKEAHNQTRKKSTQLSTNTIPCRCTYRFPHRFRHTRTPSSTLSPLFTCLMYMYRQPQQTNTGGSCQKAALGKGWWWWLQTLFNGCFRGSRVEQCH